MNEYRSGQPHGRGDLAADGREWLGSASFFLRQGGLTPHGAWPETRPSTAPAAVARTRDGTDAEGRRLAQGP